MIEIVESITRLFFVMTLYIHWRNRPWRRAAKKAVSDPRLGKLGLCSIWCDHPGVTCSCRSKRS